MFICVIGKRSSTVGSVMVAPEHLTVRDHMTCPSLGANIFVTPNNHHHCRQPSPPFPDGQHGTAIVNYQARPSLPHIFTKLYLQSLAQIFIPMAPTLAYKDRFPTLSISSIVLLFSIAAPAPQCWMVWPHRSTNNLVLRTDTPHWHACTDLPVTKVVLTNLPGQAHYCKIQMQG
jgi:hypothetical protein